MNTQIDMFTGAARDNRTASQRKRDKAVSAPQALSMFTAADFAAPSWRTRQRADGPLMLTREDPRNAEQVEADTLTAANALTGKLL